MASIHDQILLSMKSMAETFEAMGLQLELPPRSNKAMGTEYVEMTAGQTLTAKFKFNPSYTNPLKMLQGGFICAAMDEVFGPLTYMAAQRPSVTIEMSTSFVRPFTSKDEEMIIKAVVTSKSKSLLLLSAEARTADGKLIATATNHTIILSDENLKKHRGS
jgi:acyl-coenzyme A thioesterase PaaI-like protein